MVNHAKKRFPSTSDIKKVDVVYNVASVNMVRVKKKLASLLTDKSTTTKEKWNEYKIIQYRIAKLQRDDPKKCEQLTLKLEAVLEDWEKAINNS